VCIAADLARDADDSAADFGERTDEARVGQEFEDARP